MVHRDERLFRDPVLKTVTVGDTYHMYFGRPMVCFNSLHLSKELVQIPSTASSVCMHVTDLVTLIDHTTATILLEFAEGFKRADRGVVTITGLEKLRTRSHSEASMRISAPILAQERAEALTTLSRVSLTQVDVEITDPLRLLEQFSLRRVETVAAQEPPPLSGVFKRAGSSISGMMKAVKSSLPGAVIRNEAHAASSRDLDSTSHMRSDLRANHPTDIEKPTLESSEELPPVVDPSEEQPEID